MQSILPQYNRETILLRVVLGSTDRVFELMSIFLRVVQVIIFARKRVLNGILKVLHEFLKFRVQSFGRKA